MIAGVVVIFGLGVVVAGVVLTVIRPNSSATSTLRWTESGPDTLLLTGVALVIVGAISVAIAILTM
jgi:hypothetical protein